MKNVTFADILEARSEVMAAGHIPTRVFLPVSVYGQLLISNSSSFSVPFETVQQVHPFVRLGGMELVIVPDEVEGWWVESGQSDTLTEPKSYSYRSLRD